MHRNGIRREGVQHDQVVAAGRRSSVSRASPTKRRIGRAGEGNRSDADPARCGSLPDRSRRSPVLAGLAMTGERSGAETDDGNMIQTAAGGAGGTDGFGDRTPDNNMSAAWRTARPACRRRCAGAARHESWCRDRAAGLAVGDFGDPVDAEKTARRFDRRYPGRHKTVTTKLRTTSPKKRIGRCR